MVDNTNIIENPREHLEDNYGSSDSILSYMGESKIYDYYKGMLKKKEIREVLSKNDSYSLMKQERTPRIFNNTLVYHPRDLMQADLFHIDKLAENNDQTKFILCVIDCYTRKVWVEALSNKTCAVVSLHLALIFDRMGSIGRVFASDKGSEFNCKTTRQMLRDRQITIFLALGDTKCAIVERFQKTFQSMLYRYLVEHETYRYIDKLQTLASLYNATRHSSINMTPLQAEKIENREALALAHARLALKTSSVKVKPKFKIGDVVRVSFKKNVFSRSYDIQNTHQRYIVAKIDEKRKQPSYFLKNEKGIEVTGRFMQHQLTKITTSEYRGNVIKTRTDKKGRLEHLFRFVGYGPEYDLWLSPTQMRKLS